MFSSLISTSEWNRLQSISSQTSMDQLQTALTASSLDIHNFAALLSPLASKHLEPVARRSKEITIQRFGKTIQLYTPIYLSNFCMNSCLYCGFRKETNLKRKIQTPDDVEKEARHLKENGFSHILLVAGEDPRVDENYLRDVITRIRPFIPSISLEIAPDTVDGYKKIDEMGAEGIVIYQETYDRELYKKYHPSGKKSDFAFRLETPERVAQGNLHRVGIGVLLGLGDPWYEAFSLFNHAQYMLKKYWRTQITISLPRIRKAKGSIDVPVTIDDRTFTQIICALRIALPDVGILLSTRETPELRDGLMSIGITHMSAGSRTEVGGYLNPDESNGQFGVEDKRSPKLMKERIKELGYDPVWKDWEGALNDSVHSKW